MTNIITPPPPPPTPTEADWRPPIAPPPAPSTPRPFYKKKRFLIPAALLAVVAIANSAGGDKLKTQDGAVAADSATSTTASDKAVAKEEPKAGAESSLLYPGRADAQDEDQEAAMGQAVELSGYTVTPSSPTFKQSLSSFEEDGYLIVDISVLNRDDKTQSYGATDWNLQTPNGQVLDVNIISSLEPSLEMFGDLISGGKDAGKISFEVGNQKGDFYLIYKPDAFDGARGIWKVTL